MQKKNKTVGSTWSVEKVVFGGVEECNVVMNLESEKIIGWGLKKTGIGELLNGLLEKLGSVSKLYLETEEEENNWKIITKDATNKKKLTKIKEKLKLRRREA